MAAIQINGVETQVPDGAIAYKYADPTEDARWVYDEQDLDAIRSEDPSLLVLAQDPRNVTERVAAIVGDDGTGDIGVIVRQALTDDPNATDEDIIDIIREAREDARAER